MDKTETLRCEPSSALEGGIGPASRCLSAHFAPALMGLISCLLAAFADQFRQMAKFFIGNVLQKRMVRFFDQFFFVGIEGTRFLLSGDGHGTSFLLTMGFSRWNIGAAASMER